MQQLLERHCRKCAAGAATAAGAAAVSATGIGAIVVAALAVLKVVKNAVSKIAEKLGIGIKKGLEENFGKVGGAIISGGMFVVGLPFLLIGAISAAVVTPILLLVFGGLFGYQMLLGNSISSLVPPEEAETLLLYFQRLHMFHLLVRLFYQQLIQTRQQQGKW